MSIEHFEWLQNKVKWLIDNCRGSSPYGLTIYRPAAFGELYKSFYVRDFVYIVESAPECVPKADVRNSIDFLLRHSRQDGVCVERLDPEGEPIYTGHGNLAAVDTGLFAVKLFKAYMRMVKDVDFLRTHFAALQRGLEALPTDKDTGLIWIDPDNPHTSYGFADTIAKTGKELFCSLLLIEALGIMSDFAELLDLPQEVERFQHRSEHIKENLSCLWSKEDGMFFAASQDCRQLDLWGNLYACVIDAVSDEQRKSITDWFLKNQDKAIYNGHLRHLPKPEYWSRMILPEHQETLGPGKFQNGAYWSTPIGWLACALEKASPGSGIKILNEMVDEFRRNGIWECMGPDGYQRLENNVSSAVLPYKAFKELLGK